jgi:hypothetical protein
VLELPSHNVCPLVKAQGKISMRVDPLSIAGIHDGLTGRSDGNWLLEISLSRLGDPGDLRGETLNVILLLAKGSLRDEHGEIAVLHSVLLEAGVEETLNTFPNEVG